MLKAGAWLYRVGLGFRAFGYRIGVRSRARLPAPVISVGNLTVGGSGKTPFVEYLARLLLRRQRQPVILSRGYGGSFEKTNRVVSNGQELLATAAQAGDEPMLLARNLPGVPVVVGRRRAASADLVRDWFRDPVFLLDDGYQHWALARDVDLLLVDATRALSEERLLPAGRLREPLEAASRADAVVLTRIHLCPDPDQRAAEIRTWSRQPVFRFRHRLGTAYVLEGHTPVDLEGQPVVALSGIARPDLFHQDLKLAGAEIVDTVAYPDHHAFRAGEVETVLRESLAEGANWVVTTEKDAVRLYEVDGLDLSRLVTVPMRMTPLEGEKFESWLMEKLE